MDDKRQRTLNGTPYSISGHKHVVSDIIDTIALRVKKTANQSINAATNTKVIFPAKDYDMGSCWDTTLSRFTPPANQTVGVYRVSCSLKFDSTKVARLMIYINGSEYQRLWDSTVSNIWIAGTTDIQLNTKDYLEIYVYTSTSATIYVANSILTISSIF
jgi:hypothetical protein